jgi:hypothetical protein
MKKFIWGAGILMSFILRAETMINPENGEVWVITDNGAYNADNSELIKYEDKYYGSDGRIYLRQGNILMQIGGPRQGQMEQPQKIQIQITAPPVTPAPLIVPLRPHFHPLRDRKSNSPPKKR